MAGSEWTVAEFENFELEERFSIDLSIQPVTARCLINRGFTDVETVTEFLNPRLNMLTPPDKMADLKKAAVRIADAVISRQRIGVFGDYDVDGLTSASLVSLFLEEVGSPPVPQIADRFSGGYGLVPEVVASFRESGCELVVVLDCGTSDHAALEKAASLGLDVIVVDHHRIESAFPKTYAFVNPHRHDCGFPDKKLAAVGLAFYVCAAVRTELTRTGYLDKKKVDMRNYLDLVALGTIADVVPLVDNNRILASHGLKVLSEERRCGLSALISGAKIRTRKLQASHVSFQLAPRINAAGRVASAKDAFKLLVSNRSQEAEELSEKLEEYTQTRRAVEEKVATEARNQAAKEDSKGKKVLVVHGQDWHKGVLGIVAARICEEFGKPAYVVGFDGENGTGSARGQGQINLYQSLKMVKQHLVRYGGHRDAAGFMLTHQFLDQFVEALYDYAENNFQTTESGKFVCDATLSPSQVTFQLLQEIRRLGPFGQENPEPVFEITGLNVLNSRVVGGSHLKLELKTPSGTISAFGPRMGEYAANMPHIIDVAASIAVDEWRGEGVVELRLVLPPLACKDTNFF